MSSISTSARGKAVFDHPAKGFAITIHPTAEEGCEAGGKAERSASVETQKRQTIHQRCRRKNGGRKTCGKETRGKNFCKIDLEAINRRIVGIPGG